MNGLLTLTLRGPWGELESYAVALSDDIIREIAVVDPPMQAPIIGSTFAEVVEILKRREFRKDLFVQEATHLGHLLAARMEDKEGWHGADRQDALRDTVRSGA